MTTFLQNFKDSSQEFKNVRSLVTAALLIALHTVLAYFVSFQVTPSLRISVSFLANVVTGAMFGPVVGFICGGVGDIVQFVIKPTGPYFWGWTINAALAGLIYGAFLYKKFHQNSFCKMLLNKLFHMLGKLDIMTYL
ncbi:MAG: folate family ECF transporter S component [Eubacterium sp.]|nr:folate family ECF transporter S component [Eubacterium sp.]